MKKKKILIVDDEHLIRWSFLKKLESWGYQPETASNGKEALEVLKSFNPDLVFLDLNLPDAHGLTLLKEIKSLFPSTPVIIITAFGTIEHAVQAIRDGAYDFITKPVNYDNLHNTIKNALEVVSLKEEISFYREKEKREQLGERIVGESKALKDALDLALKGAKSEVSVILLLGESGTGKELFAKFIHNNSSRANEPFVAINCSAIPESLLESELFGHEKGAFTDAKTLKKGLFEIADGGVIFLDEIGDMPLPLQSKLLRVFEENTIRRIGGVHDIKVDVRIIAASNQDLEKLCDEGRFRRDLYYRLSVFPIFLPPLRERREDIIPLIQHFIEIYNLKFRKNIKGITKEAEGILLKYNWYGNVRELRNVIERAMILENSDYLNPENLYLPASRGYFSKEEIFSKLLESGLKLEEIEKSLIEETLMRTNGNQKRAAELLGIGRDALRYKLKKFNIKIRKGEITH
ncbi:MAG: sigma-54-dependent transcriptional regulator [Candidatus Aminicenantia bacterium]